jgi:hypothetical protein
VAFAVFHGVDFGGATVDLNGGAVDSVLAMGADNLA